MGCIDFMFVVVYASSMRENGTGKEAGSEDVDFNSQVLAFQLTPC